MYTYAIYYHMQPTYILATPIYANTVCHYRVDRSIPALRDRHNIVRAIE